ncbi:unnamed protein product [Ranitomeya imitator]|uniref:Chromo domain-containing protein n=1 Tax=Ranitomeya imitator TaxID=111125 RepID=A0ABN9MNH1_9NEOB|nr:unnamed protein product [Ranitomeya imitator]
MHISMDFVSDLPVSQKMSVIWVVCDRLSKMVHLVEPSDCPGADSVVDRLQQIWTHVVDNLTLSQERAQCFANCHRSLLRRYVVPVVPSVDPPAPVLVEGELEYEVEKILDSRFSRRRLQYLVKWKGYGQEDNSWVVASDVHATDLVRVFHLARPDRPGGSDPVGFIAFVKEHKLTTFVFDYKVNNKYDKKAKPYPPEKIVKAARKEVGKTRSYDLRKANCEHFATELRYGTPFSDQVEEAKIITSFGEWSLGAIGRAVNFVQKRIGSNE